MQYTSTIEHQVWDIKMKDKLQCLYKSIIPVAEKL